MNPYDDYVSELQMLNRKPAYLRSVAGTIRDFMVSMGGDDPANLDPPQVREGDIKGWITAMRGRNVSDQSIKLRVDLLRRFFDYLIEAPEQEGVTMNPVSRIAKRLPSGRRQTQRPFKSTEDVGHMIKSTFNPRNRAILTVLAKLGLRGGELTGLDVPDIDFGDRTIHIDRHFDDRADILIAGRKNGASSTLPLDDETVKVLKVYTATRQPAGDTLFVSRGGGRMSSGEVGRVVGEYVTKSGILKNGERITPHYFRAWMTYQLTINGCKPEIVQVIRGDVANTMANFYTREILSFDDVRREYLKSVPIFGL